MVLRFYRESIAGVPWRRRGPAALWTQSIRLLIRQFRRPAWLGLLNRARILWICSSDDTGTAHRDPDPWPGRRRRDRRRVPFEGQAHAAREERAPACAGRAPAGDAREGLRGLGDVHRRRAAGVLRLLSLARDAVLHAGADPEPADAGAGELRAERPRELPRRGARLARGAR